jgi:hypothetical protein
MAQVIASRSDEDKARDGARLRLDIKHALFVTAIGSGREGLFACFPETRRRKGLPDRSLDSDSCKEHWFD